MEGQIYKDTTVLVSSSAPSRAIVTPSLSANCCWPLMMFYSDALVDKLSSKPLVLTGKGE